MSFCATITMQSKQKKHNSIENNVTLSVIFRQKHVKKARFYEKSSQNDTRKDINGSEERLNALHHNNVASLCVNVVFIHLAD